MRRRWDGNGRVSRLMSHAMALKAGIGAHGLWSVSRGLARGLDSRREYKTWMDRADTPRQGDPDGRGNLSRSALVDFTLWFLNPGRFIRTIAPQPATDLAPMALHAAYGHSCDLHDLVVPPHARMYRTLSLTPPLTPRR